MGQRDELYVAECEGTLPIMMSKCYELLKHFRIRTVKLFSMIKDSENNR